MKLTERLSICWRILRAEPGNCMEHADRELPPADGDEVQALMNQYIKEMVLVFGTHGHSNFSASYAIASLEKILRFQPLRPLTGGPEEWGETFDGRCKQNKRAGNVFIGDPQRFEGQAYDIEAIVFREPTGSCFTGKGSAQPVIFPYTPRTIYVDVDAEGNPLDGWNREGVYPGWSCGAKDDTALRTLSRLSGEMGEEL